jgi:cytochrome c553
MRLALLLSHAFLAAGLLAPAHAADIEAGKAKAFACTSCHGADGVSVSPAIPNLAGQKTAYLVKQLKAFKSKTRTDPLMNAMAAQLDDNDIDNLAAFWSSLPGAAASTASAIPPHIERTRLTFPQSYQREYVYYDSINFPDRGQVRRYHANTAAVDAAREGKPMPQGAGFLVEVFSAKLDAAKKPITGSDGFFEPDKLLFYTAMETRPGWGSDFPELLRNGDWNYAIFNADKAVRPGVNQAECLACHKPLDQDSYVFTIKRLQAKAKPAR